MIQINVNLTFMTYHDVVFDVCHKAVIIARYSLGHSFYLRGLLVKITFMLKSALTIMTAVVGFSAVAADMTGAGATFPAPIYSKWAEAYKAATGNNLNYQSIGSGGGIKQIKAKTVDFGASDMPLKAEELEAAGLTQYPAVIGGVVPVVNLEGVNPGQLRLTGQVVADVYMGKITKWNAPEIVSLNPGVKLPASDITVVQRSDGSGTTFLFTDYLSKISPEFKTKMGSGTTVKWPVGVGGKGNEGVAVNVKSIKGSFGYVEYAYAKKNKMIHTQLQNADGQWVQPDDENFKAVGDSADWAKAPGFSLVLTNQPGKKSWPITGASFILVYKTQADAAKAKEVMKFFDWAFNKGGAMATELEYVSLSPALIKLVQDSWKANIKDAGGKAIW